MIITITSTNKKAAGQWLWLSHQGELIIKSVANHIMLALHNDDNATHCEWWKSA